MFDPRPGRWEDRSGDRWSAHPPAFAASLVVAVGLLALTAVIVALGLVLLHILAPAGLARWDASITRWFVERRTPDLNAGTRWASDLGATLTVVGVAVAAASAIAIARRWALLQFVVVSLVLEVSVFLITTLAINRSRPAAPRLDVSPPTSSYPSGHTAAAIVLYVGLALVGSALTRNRLLRAAMWLFAVAIPVVVGLSRLYRAMHHPTDVMASVIVATGALGFGLLSVRTASAVSERRRRTEQDPP